MDIPDARDIPDVVAEEEPLHRRIHPTFLKPDGSVSSQAFQDPEMSVDRGRYRALVDTLRGFPRYGVACLITFAVRQLGQEVLPAKELFNPAHALVKGDKPKSIARKLAKASDWVVQLGGAPTLGGLG